MKLASEGRLSSKLRLAYQETVHGGCQRWQEKAAEFQYNPVIVSRNPLTPLDQLLVLHILEESGRMLAGWNLRLKLF